MQEKKKTSKKVKKKASKTAVTKKTSSKKADFADIEISDDLAGQLESGEAHLHVDNLANLDLTSLTETLQFLEEDSEEYQIILDEIHRRPPERIQIARLGHRVWTYFYDKYLLRIGLILWLFIAFGKLANFWPKEIKMGPDQSITQGNLLMGFATAIIILLWRLFIAWQESRSATTRRKQFGIKVVNKEGRPLGFAKSFLRGFFRAVPFYLITLLTMEVGKNNRGIHDKLFGSYVLRVADDVTEFEMKQFISRNF